jgi:hypothetical protein
MSSCCHRAPGRINDYPFSCGRAIEPKARAHDPLTAEVISGELRECGFANNVTGACPEE